VGLVDLSTAEQNLVTNVSSYLTLLGQLWSSTVGVADLLETDDLFQMAEPRELPALPDLEHLRPLPCNHPCAGPVGAAPAAPGRCIPPPMLPAVGKVKTPTTISPAILMSEPERSSPPKQTRPAAPAPNPLLDPPPVIRPSVDALPGG
jgi:hypothetical protein